MYKKRKNGIIGVVIVLIILLLVFLTNIENSNISYIENIANKLVNPIQNGLTYLKNRLHGNSSFFMDINKLKTDNSNLQKRNNELEETLREFEVMKAENGTLKEYLNLTEKYSDYKTIPANVISRDISNYSRTIIINVGKKNGIKENMTVIASEGLVGYVISTTDTTSKVQTIVDSSSNTSSLLSSSRDSIVCKGQLEDGKNLKAVYIPTDAAVTQGDNVETSGLGGIYPKGIYIGKVSKVINTNNLIDRYAMVEVAVNYNKLETVLVINNE